MTYCVGFKSKTAVFLIADSLTSSGINQDIDESFGYHTTFGELTKDDNRTRQDRRYKVFKLPGNVLVTFAGDVDNALEVISIFSEELEKEPAPIVAFEKVLSSGPFPQIELLVGFMEHNLPKLYSYNYMGNTQFKEEHSIIHLGTGHEHEYLSEKISQFVGIADDLGDGKGLVFALAFLQNFAIKNSLLKFDVGGFFYGGFINSDGVQRMWNTTYLLYAVTQKDEKRNLHINYQISFTRKDDLLLVSSSFLDHHRIYLQDTNLTKEKLNHFEFKNQVNKLINEYWEGKVKFIVLLNQLNYGITVCYMENENTFSEIEISSDRDNGKILYRLSSKLVKHLLYPPYLKEEDMDSNWDRNNPAHIEIPIKWFA